MRGDHVLLITPFNSEGEIDEASLAEHIEFVIAGGVHGIVALGTTGEFFTMYPSERVQVMELTVKYVRGRVPVTFGVGDSSTRVSINLAQRAKEVGADCVMVLSPYYFAHSEMAIREHFLQVASAVDMPVMIYDGSGGIEVSIETLVQLRQQAPNISCAKFSLPKPTKIRDALSRVSGMKIFCGDEYTLMLGLRHGAVGSTIAAGNLQPDVTSAIYNNFSAGHTEDSRRLYNEKLLPAATICATSKSEYIRCFKEVLAVKGIIQNPFTRLPLLPLDPLRREELLAVMKDLKVL